MSPNMNKSCLILDRQQWRYRKSLSDLSGRDIRAHKGGPTLAIAAVRNWLVTESGRTDTPGGTFILQQYRRFRRQLPTICVKAKRNVAELSFSDYRDMVTAWLSMNAYSAGSASFLARTALFFRFLQGQAGAGGFPPRRRSGGSPARGISNRSAAIRLVHPPTL